VNKGPYIAIVDQQLCENKERDQNGGQSMMNMKLNVTREPNRALEAKGWIAQEEDGHIMNIRFQLKIAEGSSIRNPLGIFRFNWGFFDQNETQNGGGMIESYRSAVDGSIGLRFYETSSHGEGEGSSAANALMSLANGEIVGGRVSTYQSWNEPQYSFESDYKVSFNSDYLAKVGTIQDGSSDSASGSACIDRGNFNSIVYRYGLYNADGSRKNLNSGFPIEFDYDGQTRHGHASYWGIWTEGEIALDNGTSVRKVDWSSGEKVTEDYTVVHAPGKLVKYSKNAITLGDLKNTDLEYWSNTDSKQYIVHWNGSNFEKKSEVTYGDEGPEYTETSGILAEPEWGYYFWVESMSANINIPRDATLSDNLTLSYHSQEVVSGSQTSDLTGLRCFSRCPKMSATYDSSDSNWAYKAYPSGKNEWDMLVSDGAIATYSFDASTKNLSDGASSFSAPSGGEDQGAWIDSGVLVTDSQLNSLPSTAISPYELESRLDTYYRWESSSNSWGQYYGLANASTGESVTFDKPLEFKYTHSQAKDYDGKDDNSSYGKTFRISYGGFGDLWGIPWKKVDGAERDRPLFSLASGTELSDGSNTYRVKPLEVAQWPTSVDSSLCSDLDPNQAPELPTSDVLTSIDNGAEPADDDTPIRVIEGEVVAAQ
jgi:hypothetical protein